VLPLLLLLMLLKSSLDERLSVDDSDSPLCGALSLSFLLLDDNRGPKSMEDSVFRCALTEEDCWVADLADEEGDCCTDVKSVGAAGTLATVQHDVLWIGQLELVLHMTQVAALNLRGSRVNDGDDNSCSMSGSSMKLLNRVR
jgi:hypothetical protein